MTTNFQVRAWLIAARPKTLPAAIVPVWCGTVLAWMLEGRYSLAIALCTCLSAVAIQIATNLFNDVIDCQKGADTTQRIGPQRVTSSGLLSPKLVITLACGFLLLAVCCAIPLYQARGWPVLAIGLPSLFLAYGYTGGPLPLAYRGLGELFVLGFFGWIAVSGTVYLQTACVPPEAWLLGSQVGLLSTLLISINNFRDREEDALTGKRTLAVRLGPKLMAGLIWLEIKLAAFLGLLWIVLDRPTLLLGSLPVLLIGPRILWVVLTRPPGPEFNRILALAALQLILFAALFHLAAAANPSQP